MRPADSRADEAAISRLVPAGAPGPQPLPSRAEGGQRLALGVGCRVGTTVDELQGLTGRTLADAGLAWADIGLVATLDRRLGEPGLVEFAWRAGVPLVGYTAEQLAAVDHVPSPSSTVERLAGTPGVCEPAAWLASGGGTIIVRKRRSANATVAIACRAYRPDVSVTR